MDILFKKHFINETSWCETRNWGGDFLFGFVLRRNTNKLQVLGSLDAGFDVVVVGLACVSVDVVLLVAVLLASGLDELACSLLVFPNVAPAVC